MEQFKSFVLKLKTVMRLLFGKNLNYDPKEFYKTCPRGRTIDEHKATRDFTLEHTKPLLNEKEILNLENLYLYHTFMKTFMKFFTPISMRNLIKLLPRSEKLKVEVPLLRLGVSQQKSGQHFLEDYFKIGNDLDSYIKLLGLALVEHFCWNLLSTTNNHQNFGKYYKLHTPVL